MESALNSKLLAHVSFSSADARLRALRVRAAVCVGVVALTVIASALAAGEANATYMHEHLLSFPLNIPEKGPEGETVTSPGPYGHENGLALDGSSLWFEDSGFRVEQFDASTGAFLSQLPLQEDLSNYSGLAVGRPAGKSEIYVAADASTEGGPEGVVAALAPNGERLATWHGTDTPDKSFGCFGCTYSGQLAVDRSTNLGDWASGDVFVAAPEKKVVDIFKPEGNGAEKYVAQITGIAPGETFQAPQGVAVNEITGEVIVADTTAIDVFKPSGLDEYELVRAITGTPSGPLQIENGRVGVGGGPDGGNILLVNGGIVTEFNSAGEELGPLRSGTSPLRDASGVFVDQASGEVFVGTEGPVEVYGPGSVRPDVTTGGADELAATRAELHGTVNPLNEGEATCRFNWGTTPSLGNTLPCSAAVPDGGEAKPVHAALEGLQTHTAYYYRLEADNKNGLNPGEVSQTASFTTPGQALSSVFVSEVTENAAVVNSTIDPNGTPTSYYVQYGTSLAYGTDLPAAPGKSVGSVPGGVHLSLHLTGLAAATTYHYRVVTSSSLATVVSEDKTFTTTIGGPPALPDGRRYEMVSPAEKHGAAIAWLGYEQGNPVVASEDGSKMTFAYTIPPDEEPPGGAPLETTQAIATRLAPGQWETVDINTPHNGHSWHIIPGKASEYRLFSPDLSSAFVEPADHTPLPPLPAGEEHTVYLRHNDECHEDTPGNPPPTCYEALVSKANVTSGQPFGGYPSDASAAQVFQATPSLSHIALTSTVPLTSDAIGKPGNTYIWSHGSLAFTEGTGISARHTISTDGNLIAGRNFPGLEGGGTGLHDMSTGETVEIDTGHHSLNYWTASSDLRRIFYSDQKEPSGEGEMYVYELASGPGEPLSGEATPLSETTSHENGKVMGVLGASEDGSYVYFVAGGVLTTTGNAHGATPVAREPNLYVAHYESSNHKWTKTYIATLGKEDYYSWQKTNELSLENTTSRVAPNGQYLTFLSDRNIAGYEPLDANAGVPDEEVYLYDAGTGKLSCPSCNPTGSRPVGDFKHVGEGTNDLKYIIGSRFLLTERWYAGVVPGYTNVENGIAFTQGRYLSSDGRLFFESTDALVPADVNGKADVYEYEPAGVGSCVPPGYGQSASVVYVADTGGCVGLISSGRSSEESAFMEASPDGNDVYILTQSQLSGKDTDSSMDMYDAHVCTSAAPCAPPEIAPAPPCDTGDSCRPPQTPQPGVFGDPASATFAGTGNVEPMSGATPKPKPLTRAQKLARALKQCRKKPKRQRRACERHARKLYAAKKAAAPKHHSTSTGHR